VLSRIIDLTSLENARDLGGLRTGDGRRVVPGVFARSAALDSLTDADRAVVERLGITVALDLRSDMEREERPSRWPAERLVTVPLAHDGEMVDVITRIQSGDLLGRDLEVLWEANIATFAVRFVPAIRRVFDVFAGARPGRGVLFHCRGGKDRTGAVAMLLLESFGVAREAIVRDFMYTNVQVPTDERAAVVAAEFSRIKGTPVAPSEVFPFAGVRREWLERAYAVLEERYGSVVSYLVDEVGVDVTGFRERFLVEG
jgi:protein-tyrosine phosphatase